MSEPKPFLHNHPASSYAQAVRLALREKGIPFDMETPEGLGSGKPNAKLSEANPRLEVPALVDGDLKIFDSKVIVEYIEDKYPEHPLLPKDPKGKAEARMIAEVCNTQYEAINWGHMEIKGAERATGELAEKLLSKAKEHTEIIQSWLTSKLGDKQFFNGDGSSFGYADIFVIPYINRSFIYGDLDENSALGKWRSRAMERPSVSKTFEELQEAAQQMSSTFKDLFKPGTGRRREYRDHRLEWLIKAGGIEIVEKGIKENTIRFSWPGGI